MKIKVDKEQIILLLKDNDWEIRRSAINSLGKILDSNPSLATKELLEQIIPLLKDQSWSVRYSTIEVLRKIFTINKRLVNKELLDHLNFWDMKYN
jgi:HEAT repeat protein